MVSNRPPPPSLASFCGFPVFQSLGQRPPEGVEPVVGHLEHTADVSRLGTVEEQVRFRSVPVPAVFSVEHAESDQGVKKVTPASPVQAELSGQFFASQRRRRQGGEKSKFDCAQQYFGAPESQSQGHDFLRRRVCVVHPGDRPSNLPVFAQQIKRKESIVSQNRQARKETAKNFLFFSFASLATSRENVLFASSFRSPDHNGCGGRLPGSSNELASAPGRRSH